MPQWKASKVGKLNLLHGRVKSAEYKQRGYKFIDFSESDLRVCAGRA